MNYQRLLESCLREFEREVEQTVAREFVRMHEALRAGEECEIPVIGGEWPPESYRTAEYFSELQQRVVRALIARKWAEFELPRWALPLPLREEECIELINSPESWTQRWGRSWLRVEYSRHLRSLGWHLENVRPFEKFCAEKLRPPQQTRRQSSTR